MRTTRFAFAAVSLVFVLGATPALAQTTAPAAFFAPEHLGAIMGGQI